MADDKAAVHPVQVTSSPGRQAYCPTVVTLRAYEVYCHVFRPQEAIVTGGCRGGLRSGTAGRANAGSYRASKNVGRSAPMRWTK